MFIVIDGIDGSGKGTQTELLKTELEKLGKKVKIYDFPRYEEDASIMVRKYLNGAYGRGLGAKPASIFYAIDRFDASFSLREDLKNYDYIISNRYTSASMIHQGGKIKDENELKDYVKWLEDLEFNIFGIVKPDKTIFLTLPVDTAIKLVEMKKKREYIKNGDNKDIHEDDKDHLINAYNSAQKVATMQNWTKIECVENGILLPKSEITQKILKEVL
ncbi:MAG: thymidylate kinase [Candidatus Gracilibacteria bacterium]|nr:thymidylate kinase [Candidatus Gracilibacteria bacterium]MDD3120171.1 thymidylate kinase [Candidatus Gracilibacteria bacterium]